MKQTKEERIGFLENEQTYLKTRITRLKNNKKDPREPDLIAWYLKIAEENYKKNENELKQLQAKDE
tara:strand:- start:172 stop:369 length:198 start_codon:yes stop_codon:yes gene_type:complete